jgi:hypothetical protein
MVAHIGVSTMLADEGSLLLIEFKENDL